METAVYTETAGKIKQILLGAGKRVESHDLVLIIDVS